MRYCLAPLHCRSWLLNSLSLRLIESHYEGGCGWVVLTYMPRDQRLMNQFAAVEGARREDPRLRIGLYDYADERHGAGLGLSATLVPGGRHVFVTQHTT